MVVGVGVDIVDIARFERALARTPALAHRLFGDRADLSLPGASLAARFAAKEATLKALGGNIDGFLWSDIDVQGAPGAPPNLHLFGGTKARALDRKVTSHHLSLSHDAGMAIAFVVMDSAS
jgi:holo-[acyl-carrier protein] synthase